jgi:formate hydrogenlyase transcriptional activator
MIAAGLKATMAFPLIARGKVVGSLHFSFRTPPQSMNELAGFLSDLSGQVALAVDNMLSHAKLTDLNRNLEQQKSYLMNDLDVQYRMDDFHYSSPVMREIIAQVDMIADSDASVLITGETGTGKDFIARYIHHLSGRRNAMFVKVNCPALPESLFESEMFGHAKGAFTGALSKRVGRFEMASGGTIFLDEIGELPLPLQAKLLQVLQDMRFERVGDSRSVAVDFRVIAATNKDLISAIQMKAFRSDLYYRLNTVTFHVPPLRERQEEIEPLVRRFTRSESESMRRTAPVFSDQALDSMKGHSWPGNLRELKNIVKRLVIVFSGKTVHRKDIDPLLNIRHAEASTTSMALREVERAHLIKVLTLTKGVVGGKKGAAHILKIPKSTLQYRLHKHGIDPLDFTE